MESLAPTTRTPTRKAKKNQQQQSATAAADTNGSVTYGSSEKSELAFGEGLRRRRRDTSGREYDEVDDRITIPLASSRATTGVGSTGNAALHNHKIGVSVSTSASSSGVGGEKKSESILQTGLSKYRSLSGKTQQSSKSSTASGSSSSSVVMSTATSSTITTTTTAAASTTSSPTVIIPGASLNVRMEDSSRLMTQPQRNAFFSGSSSRNQQQQQYSSSSINNRSSMTPSTRQQQYQLNTGSGGVLPDLSPLDHATRLMNQKQYAAAIPFFTDALSSSSSYSNSSSPMQQQSKVRIYHDRGYCFLMAQRYAQAIEDFTRVMSMAPKNAQLFARRAKAYAHVNQHQAALSDYNEAITITASAYASVNRAELRALYLARSRVYSAMNKVHEALDDLAKAESTGGYRDAELYYQRASLHLKRNQNVLALKDFDRFLELQDELPHQDVDNVNGVNGSGAIVDSEALERMEEVLFDHAKLLQQLAAEEDAQQRKDMAFSAFEQGKPLPSTSAPNDKNARRPVGYRSAEAIALELRAIKDYTMLLESDPANTETLWRRGEAYGHIERYEDAFKDFDLAHRLDPNDFEVNLARAKVYHQQNNLEKAIDEITTVLKVNGFFVDALFFRARLYEQVGDVLKAQRDYTSVIEAHYDLRGESYSDAGNATNATEKTPLLSKASSSSTSNNSRSNAKTPQTVVKPAKITSEYSLRALVQRARLSVQINKFDEAIADYERILLSDANNMDAQVELPGVRKKKNEYEEKVHRDAVAWLEKEAGEKQLEAAGGGDGGGTASAAKKKKKKKAKKKKRPTQTGYVLLEDDEDDASTITITITDGSADTGGKHDKENGNAQTEEQGAVADAVAVTAATGTHELGVEQPVQENSAAEKNSAESAPVMAAIARAVSAAVTRDEACESMWEQSDDQADSAENVSESRSGKRESGVKQSGDGIAALKQSARSDDEQPTKTKSNAIVSQGDEDENAEDREEEDKEGSATDSSSNAAPREVIVDEKYLRKRQRQLENLRADFLQVCEARDKAGIEEVLERAERKQMTESLSDEIDRARAVLESIESGEGAKEAASIVETTVAEGSASVTPATISTEPAVGPESAVEKQDLKAAIASEAALVAAPQQKRSNRHSQTMTTQSSDADPSATSNNGSKPPSLVIRPIAYGQALQLAEQSQNLFLQNQRLLQEKDAEIESLRQLLAQSRRQATIERFDEAVSDELSSKFASLRSQFPHKRLRDLKNRVDVLINWMGPNDDADLTRRKILAFVHRVLEAANFALGTPIFVFPTGSFPMKTYLPTADLDVCLLLPKDLEQTWYFPVLHALCLAGSSNPSDGGGGSLNGSPNPKLSGTPGGSAGAVGGAAATGLNSYASSIATNTVRNVNFINADVRVIKCTIDNISVDFTANRVGALGALLLLDSMDARVGFEHLLKKSLILIKAWCIHESSAYTAAPHGSPSQPQTTGASASSPAGHSVLGASYGAFSTYAINTVVMSLFNQYGSNITHPLQALFLFLDRMSEFPWHEAAMTLHGPVALSALASSSSLSNAMKKKTKSQNGRNGGGGNGVELHSAKMSVDDVENLRLRVQEQFGAFDATSSTPNGFKASIFPIRVCNIVDPLDEKNNLARSVSVDWFPSMKRAFRLGRNRLGQLLSSSGGQSSSLEEVDDFFVNSWRSYGRGDGWRPDLLVHPRQVWHGKAGFVVPNGEQNDDLRWQSLLPEFMPMAGPALYQPQGAMYQQPQPYVAHHQQQQHMQHQSPHHHQHHHHQQQQQQQFHMSSTGGPVVSESVPYQQHRRSFDSKSSPLKSMTTVRQQSSPLPASATGTAAPGMAYSSGSGGGLHAQSKLTARRAYDSPSSSYMPK